MPFAESRLRFFSISWLSLPSRCLQWSGLGSTTENKINTITSTTYTIIMRKTNVSNSGDLSQRCLSEFSNFLASTNIAITAWGALG